MLEKIIWIALLFALIIATVVVFVILEGISERHKKVKKESTLSTKTKDNGHSGRMKSDVENELENIKITYLSFICITIGFVYAVVDCFMHIIK